ncbi:heterodisulfide reductase-related iron-sulfur binding cluster [uncultured Methanospirillum sp.]|uniref:CoB--CoM heterodisulfide reductase iron-sulfur subunit B family protein n=1 Tax=uncultured Methanospirillum sp. TaxID=262503 RepID=UPI0029C6121B|nr:heterodisulfide reductase-related iron-sulfur binding cluster [uncultured Methanospirillum sp.]
MADLPNVPEGTASATKPRYSFFLGCVMPVKMPWAESSIMQTLPRFGVDLEYLRKATCCPRAGVWISVDERVWLTLASYNLLQAEGDGRDVMASCNGCYVTLYEANKLLKENPEKLKEVNGYLAEAHNHYNASIRVRHLLEVLYEEVGVDRIRQETRKVPIRVALHPGCHMRIFEDGRLVRYFTELTGALVDEVVPYEEEQMCCGLQANLADRQFATYERAKKKFDALKALNVDALVIVCSGCYDQFERAVQILKKEIGYEFDLPIIHLAELLALSLGISPDEFGMRYLRTAPVDSIIEKWESDRR